LRNLGHVYSRLACQGPVRIFLGRLSRPAGIRIHGVASLADVVGNRIAIPKAAFGKMVLPC
jgi:hypothetical protein